MLALLAALQTDWAAQAVELEVLAGVAEDQLARRLHLRGSPSLDTTHGVVCALLTVMVLLEEAATMATRKAATEGAMHLVWPLVTMQGRPCRVSSTLREAVW